MMDKRSTWKKIGSNWRMALIMILVAIMILIIKMMSSSGLTLVDKGKADLTAIDFGKDELVALNGRWEFYWDKLLTAQDFSTAKPTQMDSFVKVPGSWNEKEEGTKTYPKQGVATYRMVFVYPVSVKDPALRIQNVTCAYKLYINGRFTAEVGTVSDDPSIFKEGIDPLIFDLPTDTNEVELIIQVANLNYAKGGLRECLVFGSKNVLVNQKMVFLTLQLLFTGSILAFAVYYLFMYFLQRKNKSLLFFSILCYITVLRSLLWGTTTAAFIFHEIPYQFSVFINYLTGYNLIPVMVLFILSLYPLEHNKIITAIVLLPTLFFDLLLFTPTGFMSLFTDYLYLLILLQMLYIIYVMMKAVLRKRDNAIIMFITECIFVLTIILDILYYKGRSDVDLYLMFLYGNFIVIIAMSFVQARIQSDMNKKLILYNENLVEAERLKTKIMEREMSFLQAQIKPHFLYNALDAIANVCEEDGEKASELIVDLSIYLRRSLEFNGLDKMMKLEKELEFVETYFNIELARFGAKIQLFEELEVSLDNQLPALVLQPLVENAVRHGISKKQQGGKVIIRAKQLTEGILIEVLDDGVGIEEEKLTLLLSEERENQGIGLLNIHSRLLNLYGRGLKISSEEGTGTCVSFVIPKGANYNDKDSSS